MGTELTIRADMDAGELRRLARQEKDGRVAARMLAIANALDGMDRKTPAKAAGMDRQTLRDWVLRFNESGLVGLKDRPRSGRPPRLSEGQQATLRAIILRGPDPEKDGISGWRIQDLCRIVEERFGVVYAQSGMLKLVKSLDLSCQKTRPKHPQADPAAAKAFKRGPCDGSDGRHPGAPWRPCPVVVHG